MFGRSVGQREDKDPRQSGGIRADRCDDCARAILLPFLSATQVFGMPKIAVTYDKAGNRLGERHVRSVKLGIEMRELVWHLGLAYRVDPFLGKVSRKANVTIPPLEPCILFCRDDHDVIAAVLSNGHGLAQGLLGHCAERPLKLAF